MFVPFRELGGSSRVWIYQCRRTLSPSDQIIAEEALTALCANWSAHGNPLRTSFKIEQGCFLILAVDEARSGVSGCSIDGSVHVLKHLQKELENDFFDRSHLAFLIDDKISMIGLEKVKEALENGTLTASSQTFNVLVATKDELDQQWIQPLEKTWLARYLPKKTVA